MTRRGRRRMPRQQQRRGPVATVVGVFGELLLTAGVLVVLFIVYQLFGTGVQTAQAQDELLEQFQIQPENPEGSEGEDDTVQPEPVAPEEADIGDAYAVLRIPRFGGSWEYVVVQGTEESDLKRGPGHYLDTANPGEMGNFSVAGHRAGHGQPFAAFPELRAGDVVEVQTSEAIYTYELDDAPDGDQDGNRIGASDTQVVWPNPEADDPNAEATEERVTLTTCWPRWGSSHRMYATGTLVSAEEV